MKWERDHGVPVTMRLPVHPGLWASRRPRRNDRERKARSGHGRRDRIGRLPHALARRFDYV